MSKRRFLGTMQVCILVGLALSCGGANGAEEPTKVPAMSDAGGEDTVGRIEGTSQTLAADPGEATEIGFTMDGAGVQGPDSVSAGWVRILFENTDDSDHHLALIKLTGGKTADDLRSYIQQDPKAQLPNWALASGGPADTSPGVTAVLTQDLQEGSYVWVTYVLGDDEIARPGLELMRPFEVTASSVPGTEPTADVVLIILDHNYNINDTRDRFESAAIASGPRIIKIANESKLVHEARILAIEGGKQAKDFPDLYYQGEKGEAKGTGFVVDQAPFPVVSDGGKGPGGPPPGIAIGGVMALQPGHTAYLTTGLDAGWYFVYDMLEDTQILTPYLLRPTMIEFPVR